MSTLLKLCMCAIGLAYSVEALAVRMDIAFFAPSGGDGDSFLMAYNLATKALKDNGVHDAEMVQGGAVSRNSPVAWKFRFVDAYSNQTYVVRLRNSNVNFPNVSSAPGGGPHRCPKKPFSEVLAGADSAMWITNRLIGAMCVDEEKAEWCLFLEKGTCRVKDGVYEYRQDVEVPQRRDRDEDYRTNVLCRTSVTISVRGRSVQEALFDLYALTIRNKPEGKGTFLLDYDDDEDLNGIWGKTVSLEIKHENAWDAFQELACLAGVKVEFSNMTLKVLAKTNSD